MLQQIKTRSFALAFVVTLVCSLAGSLLKTLPGFQLIGALVIALLLGMAAQLIPGLKPTCISGTSFIANKFLRLGIILLGFKLNLIVLASKGPKMLLYAAFVVTVVIIINYLLLKHLFHTSPQLSLLTASGCGICGAAAIMGISPILKAKKDDTVLAVAVICVMGTLFTLLEVQLFNHGWLNLTSEQYGIFAGGSLHEIAHAVAAGNAGGAAAEEVAVLSKLSRVIMLVPVALIFSIFANRNTDEGQAGKHKLPIPWFMLGFLAASACGTYVSVLAPAVPKLVDLAYLILGMAMAALGINMHYGVIKERGGRVLTGAFIGSVAQMLICLVIARLFF